MLFKDGTVRSSIVDEDAYHDVVNIMDSDPFEIFIQLPIANTGAALCINRFTETVNVNKLTLLTFVYHICSDACLKYSEYKQLH